MAKKVLIVDDEKLARDRIARFIEELGYEFEVEKADSGLAALEVFNVVQPDLLFLDIQMPGLNGFEFLEQVAKRNFKVIFQTAFDEFAIEAFNANASDYLLKPFSKERFKAAVDKCLSTLERDQRLTELEEAMRKREGALKKISVRQGSKIHLIDVDEVVCFVSKDHYTCIYTRESDFVSDLSLTHLEERLSSEKFMRCHRNSIVRLDCIEKIVSGANMTLHLANGMELPVSRQKRQTLTQALQAKVQI